MTMEKMDSEFIKGRIAPCGLHCGKCFAFADGDISYHSNELKKSLGNFEVYAQRFVEMLNEPVFAKYADFKEFLDHLSVATCQGCRKEKCKLFKTCNVRACSEEKQVVYCFQCSCFPCENTGFDEHLYKRFVAINKRMQEVGVEKYYEEVKDLPRY